jgi:predicted nucleic acid-binding protein
MAPLYVDTSALVKFYYPEEGSDRVEELLLKADRVYISDLTMVEMASALTQKVRTGDLSKRAETMIWTAFLDDMNAGTVEMAPLLERHYSKAANIIREYGGKHGIKTLDALHLSLAHSLRDSSFLSSDKILLRIATAMGLATVQR